LASARNSGGVVDEKSLNVTIEQRSLGKIGCVRLCCVNVLLYRASNFKTREPDAFAKAAGSAEQGHGFQAQPPVIIKLSCEPSRICVPEKSIADLGACGMTQLPPSTLSAHVPARLFPCFFVRARFSRPKKNRS